ncbi:interferon-induced, double-stranded RNA-activated protein kinase isoform X2 [Folsomia candida]|uniref:interferon-induced, double-stranded RNA-activated protein kinase isoform X2 n=1 Tax=Folsomia candida TaxID=158441 RepID=UPI0016054EEB|nr:interferon-induced, double-stranded RNA-activated protein kinase isoform X2 [Folsomia candida]
MNLNVKNVEKMASKNHENTKRIRKRGYTSRIYSDYELLWELGRGGFGIVWAAQKRGTSSKNQRFAVKRTFANIDPVELLDSWKVFGGVGKYCPITIVTEFCELGTLEDWLKKNDSKNRDVNFLLDFASQMTDGLRFLHFKGIIHRDLKPSNMFLNKLSNLADEKEITLLMLGDFGLSKCVGQNVLDEVSRKTGKLNLQGYSSGSGSSTFGTLLYRSPDQEDNYGFEVDVYAMGLIVAELFLPYPAKLVLEKLKEFTSGEACTLPGEINSAKIPAPLLELILQMMSKSPQDRPDSSAVHSRILEIIRATLLLPVDYYIFPLERNSRRRETWIERPELARLLYLYNEKKNHAVVLSGRAGFGKKNLALQFIQKLMISESGTSIVWISLEDKGTFLYKLQLLGRRLKANISQWTVVIRSRCPT